MQQSSTICSLILYIVMNTIIILENKIVYINSNETNFNVVEMKQHV